MLKIIFLVLFYVTSLFSYTYLVDDVKDIKSIYDDTIYIHEDMYFFVAMQYITDDNVILTYKHEDNERFLKISIDKRFNVLKIKQLKK